MARIVKPSTKFSGKIDGQVHVNSRAYGPHTRKAPAKGVKNATPAFAAQQQRAALLNKLAGELKTILQGYSDNFMRSGFYHQVLTRFRKQPTDNRLLLLWQLKDMDINASYPLRKLGFCMVTVSGIKKHIQVNLRAITRPVPGRHKADCYCYEVILLTWTKTNAAPTHSRQYSEWISREAPKPEFEFLFPKPAGATHWLVCIKQQLGRNEKNIEAFAAMGMKVMAVGSFDKKEMELLEGYVIGTNVVKKVGKQLEEVVRVKAMNKGKGE